jgi:cellulose synthase (UDP-forming)
MNNLIHKERKLNKLYRLLEKIISNEYVFLRWILIINLAVILIFFEWLFIREIFYSFFACVIFFAVVVEIYFYWEFILLAIDKKYLQQELNRLKKDDYPRVNLFINCVSHPLSIIEKILQSLVFMDYPKNKLFVYVLDNNNSQEIEKLTECISCQVLESNEDKREGKKLNKEKHQLMEHFQKLDISSYNDSQHVEILGIFDLQVNTEEKNLISVLSWFDTLYQDSIPKDVWFGCQTLLAEAFANAVKHAHKQLPVDTIIKIEVVLCSEAIYFRIWDCGPSFDFESYLNNTLDIVDDSAESGRGIIMMKQLADYLSYIRFENTSNCFVCIKFYSKNSSDFKKYQNVLDYLNKFKPNFIFQEKNLSTIVELFFSETKLLKKILDRKNLDLNKYYCCQYINSNSPVDPNLELLSSNKIDYFIKNSVFYLKDNKAIKNFFKNILNYLNNYYRYLLVFYFLFFSINIVAIIILTFNLFDLSSFPAMEALVGLIWILYNLLVLTKIKEITKTKQSS